MSEGVKEALGEGHLYKSSCASLGLPRERGVLIMLFRTVVGLHLLGQQGCFYLVAEFQARLKARGRDVAKGSSAHILAYQYSVLHVRVSVWNCHFGR